MRLVSALEKYGQERCAQKNYPECAWALCRAFEVAPMEMAGAYTAFVNRGIRVEPLLVTRIEDSFGNVVANFVPRMQEIFSETTSYKMLDMLKAVVDGGTGGRLRRIYNLKSEMGAKTGTTNDNSDAWFMSFTPEIVASAWVGGEEPSIRFDNMAYGQGAAAALPIPESARADRTSDAAARSAPRPSQNPIVASGRPTLTAATVAANARPAARPRDVSRRSP